MLAPRRRTVDFILAFTIVLLLLALLHRRSVVRQDYRSLSNGQLPASGEETYNWRDRPIDFPVAEYQPLPKSGSRRLPDVQYRFPRESKAAARQRKQRQAEVKRVFQRCWAAYREYAWLEDEVSPLSASNKSTFGGWAATLVDSLDTLWIMELKAEFAEAVDAVVTIDFTNSTSVSISVFETTIRYLGGMLGAYDLSKDKRLLHKAVELAHTLYAAFDTPNRLPINWWRIQGATIDMPQVNEPSVLVAEIGSLCLEFTRLSQITKDPMWYDAVHRIMQRFEEQQNATAIPGLWPMSVSPVTEDFSSGTLFTIGAMADSLYEYLPKMYALLGGSEMYERMYRDSMESAISNLLYQPMLPDEADVLMAGKGHASDPSSQIDIEPAGEHLSCFAGGMFALGGRLLQNDEHIDIGRRLTDGCIWAYNNSQLGIMPEGFTMMACETEDCLWDESAWMKAVLEYSGQQDTKTPANVIADLQIPRGFLAIDDRRYLLRPEAIESVFVLYRITGDTSLQDTAWQMFANIDNYTRTDIANAALADVTSLIAPKQDSMESFWLAETLKYFYLVFSPPDLISLDEYVLNTEAHPFRRPQPGWWS